MFNPKKKLMICVAAVAIAASAEAMSAEMPKLAVDNDCQYCHAIDQRKIGPAWIEVAKRYRNQPDAETRLILKVSKGGKGEWGQMPMPPNDKVSEKDIRALVRYILSLK